ncbi:rRNA maturation RNase YbeY [Mycoplasma crocodyli]|uniref:Endoribonuclease YbeY n=1 Tax=Mycoplasma crocodyli (strain ATCC 51981 / MP145) TaxID=512564 RepID=D5E4U6_MYCCM|nr:rRNA maturation RNase YbeY [Mycoplasma crocodyli]ADE19517.1 conserved hypothetical metalloprotease [Mycoplasma crocodyli MP145]
MNNLDKNIEINYANHRKYGFKFKKEYQEILKNLVKHFNIKKDIQVDVTFVDNKKIKELNKSYRNKDYVTDILSFDFGKIDFNSKIPFIHLGELVISSQKVEEQSQEFNHSLKREYCYLFAHGLIHLMGYDHELEDERIEMNKLVDTIFSPLNITREEE